MTSPLLADIRRCADSDLTLKRLPQLFAQNYGLHAMLAYRLGRWLLRSHREFYKWPLLPPGWLLYYLLSRYVRLAYDIRLELSADIGHGFYIGHFGALRVRNCRIGTHCSVGHLTHIGPVAGGHGPVIGDRVWIGGHAQIVGPYKVGSDATVSAGSVVLQDIASSALCMGNPARIVLRGYDNRSILGLKEQAAAVVRVLPSSLTDSQSSV